MFQEALIESAPHRTWKVGTVVVSAFIHTAVVGVIVWASAKSVGEIENPPVPLFFKVGLTPPSPGNESAGGAIPRARDRAVDQDRTASHAEQFHREGEIARESSTVGSSEPIAERDQGSAGGDHHDGDAVGDRQGIVGGTGDIPGALDGGDEPISISGRVRPPVLITRVEPLYPEAARRIHLSGVVVLQAVITTGGRVEDLRVSRSSGALLDAAAIAAVEKWIYQPATLNGRSVKVFLTVSVDFALH